MSRETKATHHQNLLPSMDPFHSLWEAPGRNSFPFDDDDDDDDDGDDFSDGDEWYDSSDTVNLRLLHKSYISDTGLL
jgi:hypothetical protein